MTEASDPSSTPTDQRPRLSPGRLAGIAAAVALAVIGGSLLTSSPRCVETGIVVAVSATSLSDVQGFSIRTSDGQTIDFRIGTLENATTFPVGHLAEHRASLVPVRVTYVDQGGAHVAIRIEDAEG